MLGVDGFRQPASIAVIKVRSRRATTRRIARASFPSEPALRAPPATSHNYLDCSCSSAVLPFRLCCLRDMVFVGLPSHLPRRTRGVIVLRYFLLALFAVAVFLSPAVRGQGQ